MRTSRHHIYRNNSSQKQRVKRLRHDVYSKQKKKEISRKHLKLGNSDFSQYLRLAEYITANPIVGIIALLICLLSAVSGAFIIHVEQSTERQHETILELIHINEQTKFPMPKSFSSESQRK